MDWIVYLAGPLVGFIGMVGGGYWGVGCGWIVVPVMLILGFDPFAAVGIGLLQMVPSTFLTVMKQAPEIGWKRGGPGMRLALPIGAGAFITSFSGKIINEKLIAAFGGPRPLQWLLIGFISLIAIQTLCSRTACYDDEMPEITRGKSRIAFGAGMLTGVVSSLLGVGGGILIRPLLTSAFRVPEYYTSRIVRLLVLVTTVSGGLTYLFIGGGFQWQVLWVALSVAAGGIIGFPLGVKMHKTVYDAGYAQHIHKSFASIAVLLPANTLLNMYGRADVSRIMMVLTGVILCAYLFGFTWYAKRHRVPR